MVFISKESEKYLNQEELNKLCHGLEKVHRKDGIKKLMAKGYSMDEASEYYNIWRKYYVTTFFNIT